MNWIGFMAAMVSLDLASVASLRSPSASARGYGRDRPANPLTIYLTPQYVPAGSLSAEADTKSEVRVEGYDRTLGSGGSGGRGGNRYFGSGSSFSSSYLSLTPANVGNGSPSGNRHRPAVAPGNRPPIFGRPPPSSSPINRPPFGSSSASVSSSSRPPLSSASGSSLPPFSGPSSSSTSTSSTSTSSTSTSTSSTSTSTRATTTPTTRATAGPTTTSTSQPPLGSSSSNILFGSIPSSSIPSASSISPDNASAGSTSSTASFGSGSSPSGSSDSGSSDSGSKVTGASGAGSSSSSSSGGSSSSSSSSSTSATNASLPSSPDCNGSSGMEMMGGEIPGRADIDYPVLSSVPDTSFSCRSQLTGGYYADVEARCQVFHVCHDYRKSSFLCPNGTLFDQQNFVCNWYFNVNCAKSPQFFSLNANIGVVPEASAQTPADDPFQTSSSVQQPNAVWQQEVEDLTTDLLPPAVAEAAQAVEADEEEDDDFFDYSYLPPPP